MTITATHQMTQCINMAEQKLMVAAWRDPAAFIREVSVCGLSLDHIEDRLVEVTLSYLIDCADTGNSPVAAKCEDKLRSEAVPYDPEHFGGIFLETTLRDGDTIYDLIQDVLEYAEERAQRFATEQVVGHWRQVNHWRNCSDCIRCANGQKRKSANQRRARRPIFEYQY